METHWICACLFALLLAVHAHTPEPTCLSQFDHDYKMLQKLVDLEHAQKELAAKMTEMKTEKKTGENRCPNGWMRYETSCYLFVPDIKMTWEQGLAHCENLYSHLVAMETYNEQRFLTNAVKQLKTSGSRHLLYWVGATDQEKERTWVWQHSGTLVSDGGAQWYSGNPGGGASQNCGCLWGDIDYTFHDHVCSSQGNIICEKDM